MKTSYPDLSTRFVVQMSIEWSSDAEESVKAKLSKMITMSVNTRIQDYMRIALTTKHCGS